MTTPPIRIAAGLGAALTLAGVPGAAAAPAGPAGVAGSPNRTVWSPDVRAARAYAERRRGEVAFSLRTPRRAWSHRGQVGMRSASVVKAMLMVAYLDQAAVRSRPLRRADRALLGPMVRFSDNRTATVVYRRVGALGLLRVARRARMRRFSASPVWGFSRVDAADQARFFLRIDALVPPRHRATALGLLASIVPEQRWGIARATPPGWRLHFKGGWGVGTPVVNHQVALLVRGERRVALAVLTRGAPSHAHATETQRAIARHLLGGLAVRPRSIGEKLLRPVPRRWARTLGTVPPPEPGVSAVASPRVRSLRPLSAAAVRAATTAGQPIAPPLAYSLSTSPASSGS